MAESHWDKIGKKKILEKADNLAEYWSKSSKWVTYGLVGAVATIGVASVLDGANKANERARMYKQQRIQERNLQKKNENSNQYRYMGMTNPSNNVGLVQGMFNNRSGHSNSWGGRRY